MSDTPNPWVDQYLQKVTSEHRQPLFLAALSAVLEGAGGIQELLSSYPTLFDLDTSVGDQLDKVGTRVGPTRFIEVELPNVYFSWDTLGLGWEQGIWWHPFDPTTGLFKLDDDHYRILLKARVVANNWDGTVPGAYTAWDTLFEPEGYHIIIQDGGADVIYTFKWDDIPAYGWDSASWNDYTTFRANFIRNNMMVGAAVNTATLPTRWTLYSGLVALVENVDYQNGVDLLHLQLSGTTTGTETNIYFEEIYPSVTDRLLGQAGQVWTLSSYLQVVADDVDIVDIRLEIMAINVSNNTIDIGAVSLQPTRSIYQRASITYTLPNTTERVRVRLRLLHANAASVSYRITIGSPQFEESPSPTAIIRTSGSPIVVYPESAFNSARKINGGMNIVFGLVAPYATPPPTPIYFKWDDIDADGWDNGYWDVTPTPIAPPLIDAVTMSLFVGGYLDLQPAAVSVEHATQSLVGTPMFAWDVEAPAEAQAPPYYLAGWDIGAWATFHPEV